jgi:muconolactone D-isomerase
MSAEFLVNIRFLDDGLDADAEAALVAEERAQAAELAAQGHLLRMWRVPGRRENWGLWVADDATHLHEILSGLPFWPYMDLDVHPMAHHPVDPWYGINGSAREASMGE